MMKAAFATASLLFLLLSEAWRASGASQASRQLFLEAASQLQQLDPALRGVRVLVVKPGDTSGCGPITDGDLVAHYCGRDRSIYVTSGTLAWVGQAFGGSGLRYLAAHEMAHGRQHAVTGFARNLVWSSVLDELQADCIAGSYLRRAYGYQADSAEAEPIQRFAYSIGDRGFHQKDWHGNPRLRLAALNRGLRTGDPARCLSSSRFNYASLLEQGQQWLQRLEMLRKP